MAAKSSSKVTPRATRRSGSILTCTSRGEPPTMKSDDTPGMRSMRASTSSSTMRRTRFVS